MSLVTVDEMETAFQTIFEGISGVVEYYADRPDAIQDRALPCVITSPGRAVYSMAQRGVQILTVTRQWEALVLIRAATDGRETQVEQEAKPFLSRLPERMAACHVVTVASGEGFELIFTQDSGDDGMQIIPFAGKVYGGVAVRFSTRTETTITPQSI